MTLGNAGFFRRKIGSAIATAIFDGTVEVSPENILGIEPSQARRMQEQAFRPEPNRIDTTFFVLQQGGNTILVDAGGSSLLDEGLSQGGENLKQAGIDPKQVTHILLTHLHSDHYGGLLDANGAAAFPNARLIVPEGDRRFRLEPEGYDQLSAERRASVDTVRRHIAAYRDRLAFVSEGTILPGIEAVPLPGHTPGHTGYRITDGADELWLWGDIVHFPSVQFTHPGSSMSYDVDPELASSNRISLFREVSARKALVGGAHLNFPGFGFVLELAGQFSFVPDPFRA